MSQFGYDYNNINTQDNQNNNWNTYNNQPNNLNPQKVPTNQIGFEYGQQQNISSNVYSSLNSTYKPVQNHSNFYNNSYNTNQNNLGFGNQIFQQQTGQGYNFNNNKSLVNQFDKINIDQSINANNLGKENINMNKGQKSLLELDLDLREKNFTKIQSSIDWVNHQQKSWLSQKPNDSILRQARKKFQFPNPFIKYKIIPGVDQKKALDVTAKDEPQRGLIKGHMIIWDYHGGPNQQFYIHKIQSNNINQQQQFVFINASTGFCLSAMSLDQDTRHKGFTSVYPKLQNQSAQRWRIKPIGDKKGQVNDVFVIESVFNKKCLDCKDQSKSNGTNVLLWDFNGGRNQLWRILPA